MNLLQMVTTIEDLSPEVSLNLKMIDVYRYRAEACAHYMDV